METITEEEFFSLFPPIRTTTPEEAAPAIERLLACAEHASSSGDAARAVIRALFHGDSLNLQELTRFDSSHREAALVLIRFRVENPAFSALHDPAWSEDVRRGVAAILRP